MKLKNFVKFCESNIHFMFQIDNHVQWFVDPTFQQIDKTGNTNRLMNLENTYELISYILV